MIAQPAALASWEPYLRLFPDAELVAALAPLAQRLDAALGPMRTRDRVDEGDPDGFSDIGQRGPYDRLLLSEWLLAEEAPDEFLRRAAMGEHGFLQLARRTRTGGRVSFALFDAGPSQIGGPRIAHLALLIVLARRAEAAKARFRWGILQKPEQEATVGLTESSIRALLLARTSAAATAEMWDRWRKRAAAHSDVDDFWAIGGDRLARLAAHDGAASVLVRDELGLEVSEVSAHIHRPGRSDAHVQLPLPPDALCARLLRDPFAAAVAAPAQARSNTAPGSNLLFTPSGGKLIARAQGGGLIAYPVPNSPRSGPGYPKSYQYPAHQRILAAGRIGKAYVIVTRPTPDVLFVSCLAGKGGAIPVGEYVLRTSQQQALDQSPPGLLASCYSRTPREMEHLICGLPTGEILDLHHHRRGERQMSTFAAHATLFGLAPNGVLIYGYRTSKQWCINESGSNELAFKLNHDGSPDRGMYLGYGGSQANSQFGLIAAQKDDRCWMVLTSIGEITLNAIPECQVVGVISVRRYDTPALVMLESGERRIRVMSTSWSHMLPITTAPIEHVTVSHAAPLIAYSTTEGEVFIYSLEYEAILYQLTPKESSA